MFRRTAHSLIGTLWLALMACYLAWASSPLLAAGTATVSPAAFARGQNITINFDATGGPLAGVNTPPLRIHYGFNNWSNVSATDPQMTAGAANQWSYALAMPANATQLDFVIRNDGGTTYDNNNSADWHFVIDLSSYELGSTVVASAQGGGVVFRVWAPNATSAHLRGEFNGFNTANPMTKDAGTGIWSAFMASAAAGQRYKYFLNNADWRKDPRARRVNNSNGDSFIYDPGAYNWGGDTFATPALRDMVIYEMHIGTWDGGAGGAPGLFSDAIARLDYLKNLGINVIEVMPVTESVGATSGGYNPSDPFAVETAWGSADGFKDFVKAAHARGIAVFLDVLHNHWGGGDLDLYGFDNGGTSPGIYFYDSPPELAESGFGPRPDYTQPQVRGFIKDNTAMWIEEYHVDGFRWDFTKGIRGTLDGNYNVVNPIAEGISLLRESNDQIHSYGDVVSTAEDLANDNNLVSPTSNASGYGFDSQWNVTFHHVIVGELVKADGSRSMGTIAGQLNGDFRRINYMESHDEVWNINNKDRIPTRLNSAAPTGYAARKINGMGAAVLFASEGVPLLFQGGEWGEESRWSSSVAMNWTKYTTAPYSGTHALFTDLIALRRNLGGATRGLTGDTTATIVTLETQKVVAWRRQHTGGLPGDDVVILANFSSTSYTGGFEIGFPSSGAWHEQLNTDSREYGADYSNAGVGQTVTTVASPLHGFGQRGAVVIGPYSVVILSQAQPAADRSQAWSVF